VLDEYLQVWDLREGFDRGVYHTEREKTLRTIAMDTGTPVETVRDRYQAAYRLIFAEVYTPLQWICWFKHKSGLSKLASWRKPKTPRASVTEVPETILGGSKGEEALGLVASQTKASDDTEFREHLSDICELLKKGMYSNEEIVARLELRGKPEDMKAIVQYLRTRGADGLL
jgi:hypothetical protein